MSRLCYGIQWNWIGCFLVYHRRYGKCLKEE